MLPFCGFDVTDSKPMSSAYPKNIETVGDHLRARRVEQELKQLDVSHLIGVSEATITNWENNLTVPETRYLPAIIRFLGYNPFLVNLNVFSARVKYCRKRRALPINKWVSYSVSMQVRSAAGKKRAYVSKKTLRSNRKKTKQINRLNKSVADKTIKQNQLIKMIVLATSEHVALTILLSMRKF
jgi:DNA-binding XRE family transcriptional regulator